MDTDKDGLADKLEEAIGSNVEKYDSDGDGFDDGTEVKRGFDPTGFGKWTFDEKFADRLKGRILLQVESRGEAWYVDPDDGKRYYMTDGASAYEIMRFLSLGITNADLAKVTIGLVE